MSEPVKALSIAPYPFLPPKMGGQKGIALFNHYLSSFVELHCVTTSANQVSGTEGYPVLPVLGNNKMRYINPFLFFRLKRLIKKLGITHLILEHPYYGWLGVLLKRFCTIKLVVHSHNIEANRFKSMNKWWWGILWNYEKWTHRQADTNFFIQDDDKAYAIQKFGLRPDRCFTITYGIEIEVAPGDGEKEKARRVIAEKHGISDGEKILLFNGTLDYKPNLDALKIILNEVNPSLLSTTFKYKIIICGKSLPPEYQALKAYADKHIIYAGFVDDIDLYFKAADVFVNPVTDGGGIKTKLVEALAHNLAVVTTRSGAIGVPVELTAGKMTVLSDNDLSSFANAIIKTDTSASIPASFFDHFYWGHIAKKAAVAMGSK